MYQHRYHEDPGCTTVLLILDQRREYEQGYDGVRKYFHVYAFFVLGFFVLGFFAVFFEPGLLLGLGYPLRPPAISLLLSKGAIP
jgi:hypothetical protein